MAIEALDNLTAVRLNLSEKIVVDLVLGRLLDMRNMDSWFQFLVVASSAAAISLSTVAPVQAYGVTPSSRETGGYDISLNFGDEGRKLDLTTWDLAAGSVNGLTENISGELNTTVTKFNAETLAFDFTIKNKTNTGFQSALMSMFFDVSSNLSDIQVNGTSVFNKTGLNDRATGGYREVDVCIFSSNHCNGGKIQNGLQSGSSESFNVVLTGDFSSGETVFTGFASKWQTEDGSYTVTGVPEPITLLGTLGALGVGAVLKRRSENATNED